MTHPAPSRTRRLIGSAAATVLGAVALAATSSVTASADEPEMHELRIDGSTVYLNGKLVPDRQIVILGKPFDGLEPTGDFDAEISRLSSAMAEEGKKLGEAVAKIQIEGTAMPAMTPEQDAEFRAMMDELKDMPGNLKVADDHSFSFDSNMTEEEWEAWGRKWEAWGEQFDKRADQWAAERDAKLETLDAELQPKLEKMSAELETKLDAQGAELDRLIEQKFGADFEARIELTSDAIDGLVEDCRDADLADGETRVMSRTIDIGTRKRKVKIACVKGDATAVRSARTLAVINNDKSLCPDEKKSFRDHVREETELDGADQ